MVRRPARGSRRTLESMVQDSSQRMMARRARVFLPPRSRDNVHASTHFRLQTAHMVRCGCRALQCPSGAHKHITPTPPDSILWRLRQFSHCSKSVNVPKLQIRGVPALYLDAIVNVPIDISFTLSSSLNESVGPSSEPYTCTPVCLASLTITILHAASSHAARL